MFIRSANSDDFAALREIELASFETLRSTGAVSGTPSASSNEQLQCYLDHEFLYLACNESGAAVGFCGGYVVETFLHIGEIDVHPAYQQRGLGRRLLMTFIDQGRARKLDGATLTTDRFAPFNAPFYARLGFQLLGQEATPPHLRKLVEVEVEKGLDPHRRVAMQLLF